MASLWLDEYFQTSKAIPKPWVTALDLDFRFVRDPGLGVDGAYIVGGTDGWKRENAAADRIPMEIGAAGLTIQPQDPGVAHWDGRTSPRLWLPLASLSIPALDWDTAIRVWIRIASDKNEGAGSAGVMFGIDGSLDKDPMFHWAPGLGVITLDVYGQRSLGAQADWAELNSVGAALPLDAPTSEAVFRIDIPHLAGAEFAPFAYWIPGAEAWPSPIEPGLRPIVGTTTAEMPPIDILSANSASVGPGADLGILLSAGMTNPVAPDPPGTYTVTITNLRVDYRL
jgi:hypothetical protein